MGKYNIQIASKLSGVGTHTLRAWEKRYGAVVPTRNDSGRRLYSDEDIEKLQKKVAEKYGYTLVDHKLEL